ncbi:hypothetical protein HMPREF3039_00984 [Akkermansia sp. KLE1798]|nr:hypothetical protein HMPREF3039_00984 [Akkermansia sp. KLE1798]
MTFFPVRTLRQWRRDAGKPAEKRMGKPPFCALITLCACVSDAGLVVLSAPMYGMELFKN